MVAQVRGAIGHPLSPLTSQPIVGKVVRREWNQSLPSALLWCVFLKCLLLWATAVLSIA